MTVVRVGEPLIGGPYYALNPDLEQTSNAAFADLFTACDVGRGDGAGLSQRGFGCPRATAANAIAGVLRRGPEEADPAEGMASYTVVGLET